MERITIISAIDGKPWSFPVAKGSKKQFERGKCWTAYCVNPIWFVHLTVHGNAEFGKCYCCAELRAVMEFIKKLPRHGKWIMPEKGKPIEWRFDEKKLSFSPLTRK